MKFLDQRATNSNSIKELVYYQRLKSNWYSNNFKYFIIKLLKLESGNKRFTIKYFKIGANFIFVIKAINFILAYLFVKLAFKAQSIFVEINFEFIDFMTFSSCYPNYLFIKIKAWPLDNNIVINIRDYSK
jgi:hypothetical protein